MRTLPILFNAEMIKAIAGGRKTVTRRCIRLPKWIEKQKDGSYTVYAEGTCYERQQFENITAYLSEPYRPGNILYVRETWSEWTGGYLYKTWTEPFPQPGQTPFIKWRPSIHMPKEAARIFLEVKAVYPERLQEITECQAQAEGCTTIRQFKSVWDSTIKKSDFALYGWDANPWVWVIEFERCGKDKEKTAKAGKGGQAHAG